MNPITPLNKPFGYVAPQSTNKELNDVSLRRFFQQLIVGITAMDPTKIFPRWQPEPANQPGFDVNWAAVGSVRRERETFAAVLHYTPPTSFKKSTDTVIRNQVLNVIASFYGPDNEANSELFTMGLDVAQNREAMFLNGFGFVDAGEPIVVPALIKMRWVPGIDVPFRVRRQQLYTYPIPNLEYAKATVIAAEPDGQIVEDDASYVSGYNKAPFNIVPYQGE